MNATFALLKLIEEGKMQSIHNKSINRYGRPIMLSLIIGTHIHQFEFFSPDKFKMSLVVPEAYYLLLKRRPITCDSDNIT